MFSWLIRKRPSCYYAHSLRIYGSRRERRELRFLKHRYRVTNPNGLLPRYGWMGRAKDLIDACDVVVFSEHLEHIGRGVYTEIVYALEKGKPVFVLRGKSLIPVTSEDIHLLRHNWAIVYAKVILP